MNHQLHIRFIDQSESHVLGFESGMIYQQMVDRVPLIERTVHTKNQLQLQLIAAKEGYVARFKPVGGGWSEARFEFLKKGGAAW